MNDKLYLVYDFHYINHYGCTNMGKLVTTWRNKENWN